MNVHIPCTYSVYTFHLSTYSKLDCTALRKLKVYNVHCTLKLIYNEENCYDCVVQIEIINEL